jgi:hypothetical protein
MMKFRIAILAAGLSVVGPASAASFCVASADDLTAALLTAEQNSDASNSIRIHTGHYVASEGWHADVHLRGIDITGGFQDENCQQSPLLDASLTVLDGNNAVRPLTIDTTFHDGQTGGQILITGLTFENGSGDRAGGLKISDAGPIYNGAIRVERNIFRNNTSSDYQQDNSAGGLLAATDGSTTDGATILIVRNNLFVGNRARDAAAAMLFSNNTIAINNNTFVGNQSTDATLAVRTAVATFTFFGARYTNNAFWDNNPDNLAGTYDLRADSATVGAAPHASLFNNDVQAVFAMPAAADNNVAFDPKFVDRANGDFHLASTSALIDAGLDAPATGGVGSTDVEGLPRFQGLHIDMGAYETDPDFVFHNSFD